MALLWSVNVGAPKATAHSDAGITGIDKRSVSGPVEVRPPGPRGVGGSGLVDDAVCDLRAHGGDDQAVYAYAFEDLQFWGTALGRMLQPGMFGENLTTAGIDITNTIVGEHWRVGDSVLLEVAEPRIPCRTFAGWLGEQGWIARFTAEARPGTYLRILTPGWIRAGDTVEVVHRPDHDVTVGLTFRAMTTEPDLLPRLVDVPALTQSTRDRARRRVSGSTAR